MSHPENTFIASVHRHLPVELYRMKNHNQYNGGIPDVWYSGKRSDLWVEYKFVALPKRDETIIAPDLSALQRDWLRGRHIEGRQVGVIVGCAQGGVWFPGLSWEVSPTRRDFLAQLQTRPSLAATITAVTS